jgi:hypothetical protein
MPTRVATLTRRSTDEQHQPFSIELQDTKLAAYTNSQDDWTLVRKYTDNQSGATLERPGLQRALADARAGLYDLLLVYKVTGWPAPSAGWRRSSTSSTPPGSRSARRPSRSTPPPPPAACWSRCWG